MRRSNRNTAAVAPQATVPPKISARGVIDTGLTDSHTVLPVKALATSTAPSSQ